jgi:hypothetical protein
VKVARQIQELGMIAELLEDVDRFERLRLLSAQQSLNLRRFDEEAVKLQLEARKIAEYNVLVLHRH